MSLPLLFLSLSPFRPRPSLLILTCLLGCLNLDCQGPVDIDATGQSWAWPSSWPQVQSGLWATSVDGMECPVNVVDLAPVPEQECRLGDEKKRE